MRGKVKGEITPIRNTSAYSRKLGLPQDKFGRPERTLACIVCLGG